MEYNSANKPAMYHGSHKLNILKLEKVDLTINVTSALDPARATNSHLVIRRLAAMIVSTQVSK